MKRQIDRDLAERIDVWRRETDELLRRAQHRQEQLEIMARTSERIVAQAVREMRGRV